MRETLGMERQSDGTYIKKGPWTAEEDEVLMNYVRKYGPRGWSSIRSMGLLPRTGKSCRLRWVNKLRPNLKSRGREGGDRFASTVWRKRLERILQTPQPKSQKNKGKSPVLDRPSPALKVSPCRSARVGEGSSSCEDQIQVTESVSGLGNTEEFRMVPLPDLIKPEMLSMEIEFPILDAAPIQMFPSTESSLDYPLSHLPQPQLDFPVLPLPPFEGLAPKPSDHGFQDMFEHQEGSKSKNEQKLLTKLPSVGMEGNAQVAKKEDRGNPETPDSFFDEFPTDIFDYLEPLPSSLDWQTVSNWNPMK
ncbi:hypothetical protein SLEP1_g42316 [Rubroshorea leprosula]|uniref:Uncharacterized protein n=1 Tax=Rubroshorea leprosula TaxID=152421 RepID=A0AAV5L9F3_9ROSI|nr:hypothetical protein SLEP1_g42316 [Rubroshorea leprosula]